MEADDDLVPISALQHYVYCPRQAALIHLERAWRDNVLTVEGTHLHENVDGGQREARGATRILRSVPLLSRALGVTGRADVVELRRAADDDDCAALIGGLRWKVRPVEYKRGKPKRHRADEVQLCAQALCLEEMLHVDITEGDLFYGTTRRRKTILFDGELRALTESVCRGMRALFTEGRTPPADPGPKCKNCSLSEICRPFAAKRSASRYLQQLFRSAGEAP
jgi:CRISPR-associated exonuclease Cas4